MIYFIKLADSIKIGCTGNIKRRMSELQTSSPGQLHLSLLIDGGVTSEMAIHDLFGESRIYGEWFKYTTDIDKWIMEKHKGGHDKREEGGMINKTTSKPGMLHEIRFKSTMRLRHVAEILGVTAQSVKDAEQSDMAGTISVNSLRKYAGAMGYDIIISYKKQPTAKKRATQSMILKDVKY